MSVDRSRVPAADLPAAGAIDPIASDGDAAAPDDRWYARSISDSIGLSPSASRRLAEPGRTRAFLLDRVEDSYTEVATGDGRSIVLDEGLYGIARRR